MKKQAPARQSAAGARLGTASKAARRVAKASASRIIRRRRESPRSQPPAAARFTSPTSRARRDPRDADGRPADPRQRQWPPRLRFRRWPGASPPTAESISVRSPAAAPAAASSSDDVLEFVASRSSAGSPATPAPAALAVPGATQVIPMTKMRSAIAAALQKSKQTIPHFYETIDIDVEELSKLRERINAQLEKEKVRLSIADFMTKAVAAALVRHPALNARFNPEKNEITRHADVNLGLAVAIPDGLIVPVLRGANYLGLREIRTRSADLIERARAQKLKQGEQGTGTFTISSLGTFGIREFSAIINPPEVAILAVGSAEKRAVVRGDQVVARTMLTVTLSADHRVVDGATAAEFLRTLKSMLEEPGMMLV